MHAGDETSEYSAAAAHSDHYGASKAEAEKIVLAANGSAQGRLCVLALRPGAIFGESECRHLPRIKSLIKMGFFRSGGSAMCGTVLACGNI